MPYTLTQTQNIQAIAEREWGTGPSIRFGAFTSCVGVVAKVAGQNNVIGIHLSLLDQNDTVFTATDVPLVSGILAAQNYDDTTCQVFGLVDIWQGEIPAAFQALVAALNNPVITPKDDGTYSVTLVNGAIRITP